MGARVSPAKSKGVVASATAVAIGHLSPRASPRPSPRGASSAHGRATGGASGEWIARLIRLGPPVAIGACLFLVLCSGGYAGLNGEDQGWASQAPQQQGRRQAENIRRPRDSHHPGHFAVPEFVVGGVDLAAYRYGRKEDDEKENTLNSSGGGGKAAAVPFELFEDFDISATITGKETWWDLMSYRRHLRRPSLLFYMDKVCQKRWLPTLGIESPRPLVLRYARELSPKRDATEERMALIELIPKDGDYVIKPSHISMSAGVALVQHDPATGRMAVGLGKDELTLVPKGWETTKRMILGVTAANILRETAVDAESWTLKNVEPGVVVEERFTLWDGDGDDSTSSSAASARPAKAIEFKMFNVWGRVVFGQWKSGWDQPGIVRRDGTLVDCSEWYTSTKAEAALPPWLEWERLVELSERLAVHKDFYRVDIFVGIEAGSPALRPGATEKERIAAVRYVVSETEIHPTSRVDEDLHAEMARLWVAGYKMGNFQAVKNTEVSSVFLKKGFMPLEDKL